MTYEKNGKWKKKRAVRVVCCAGKISCLGDVMTKMFNILSQKKYWKPVKVIQELKESCQINDKFLIWNLDGLVDPNTHNGVLEKVRISPILSLQADKVKSRFSGKRV